MLQLKCFRLTFLSVLILFATWLPAQVKDSSTSVMQVKDSVKLANSLVVPLDSAQIARRQVSSAFDTAVAHFLTSNPFIRSGIPASVQSNQPRKDGSRDYLFYLVAGMALVLGCLRFFYARYFTTLFRVFFNSSLRQSQLTDQLLQAKLPSLLFNIFFVITGGVFIYLLLMYFHWLGAAVPWWLSLPGCVAAIAIIYAGKYFTLKFTGWITSYKEPADTYIFIIFLINKIIGILLMPVIVLMAFSQYKVMQVAMVVAIFAIGILLIFRFFRSYGLLQGRLRVSRLHFLLYILGIEILPILMIYKGLLLYLNKSL